MWMKDDHLTNFVNLRLCKPKKLSFTILLTFMYVTVFLSEVLKSVKINYTKTQKKLHNMYKKVLLHIASKVMKPSDGKE